MARFLSLFAMMASLVAAEVTLTPSNGTLDSVFVPQVLEWKGANMQLTRSIYPLGANAGLGQNPTFVGDISRKGDLQVVINGDTTTISQSEIAYLSCDPVNLTTTNLEYSAILATLSDTAPQAIVLYSLTSENCNITDLDSLTPAYTTIYTMTSRIDSSRLLGAIDDEGTLRTATISPNATSSSSSSSTGSTSSDQAPTTAVAMSILYSITGIITLLFLIIIATGAVRAHRHPERYGPRNGLQGRPRQSRAKGLARAMLETIPIVKFGDPEPAKPGHEDLELQNGTVHSQDETAPAAATATTKAGDKEGSKEVSNEVLKDTSIESGLGPDIQAGSAAAAVAATGSVHSGEGTATAVADDDHLGCSICTEDFTRGEDVRVLPCNHKYHPACIDPWLLNVSGTCPLCRVDLRPVQSHTSTEFTPGTADSELPPPLPETEDHPRRRMSRFIDFNLIRSAPPEERIAALRRMRTEERRMSDVSGLSEDVGRRHRLAGRLRGAFGIRTRAVEVNEQTTNNA